MTRLWFVRPSHGRGNPLLTHLPTPQQAAATANAAVGSRVIASVNRTLPAGSKIETDSYSVSPLFNYSLTPPIIVGYSATQVLKVTIDAPQSQLGRLVGVAADAATNAGASAVGGFTFTLRDAGLLEQEALKLATEKAMRNADAVASALGKRVIAIVLVDQGTSSSPPIFMPALETAGPAASSAPGTTVIPR